MGQGSIYRNLPALSRASLVAKLVKNPPAIRRPGFDPWVGKILWRREKATYSSILAWIILWTIWGCKELDTTEQLSLSPAPSENFQTLRTYIKKIREKRRKQNLLRTVLRLHSLQRWYKASAYNLFQILVIRKI